MRTRPAQPGVTTTSANRSMKTSCLRNSPTSWAKGREGPDGPQSGHTDYPISTPTQSRQGSDKEQAMAQQSTILIVDDEPFNVDLLEQQLEEFGYATVSASNGQEALEKVAAEAPDLILLDVMMPVMDGFTVCRILKENDETRLIPIVIMTALGAVDDRIRGIEAGADDFLTKPVDERELLARIQTTLRL